MSLNRLQSSRNGEWLPSTLKWCHHISVRQQLLSERDALVHLEAAQVEDDFIEVGRLDDEGEVRPEVDVDDLAVVVQDGQAGDVVRVQRVQNVAYFCVFRSS